MTPFLACRSALALWLGSLLLMAGCQSPPPPLQRLITELPGREYGDTLRRAQLADLPASADVRIGWEFEGEGAEGDWIVLKDVKALRRTEGQLRGEVTGIDPSMAVVARIPISPGDTVWLRVGSEHGGNAQFFWATREDPVMTEQKSVTFFVPASTIPADVVLAVGARRDWTGNLINLRIDAPPSSGAFRIDFLRVVAHPARAPAVVHQLRDHAATAVIDGVSRLARFAYPPDKLSWEIQAGKGSALQFAYGILPEAWPLAGSSAVFSVTATPLPGGRPTTLLAQELRPHALEADRSWSWVDVPLGGFEGKRLRLDFTTVGLADGNDSGGAPGRFAYAVWGDPRVLTPAPKAPARPNVVLIAIDDARADRLGVYGHSRPTTPAIDAFAARATVFERARSQASWSLPSYASLFTSLYPSMIGMKSASDVMPEKAPTLARLLRDAGYDTAAFTGGGFAGREWGMDGGFGLSWEGADPATQVERLENWLGRRPSRPFFVYLHTFEAHDYLFGRPDQIEEAARLAGRPLSLPADVFGSLVLNSGERLGPTQMAEISLLYDGALRVADRQFGRFLKALRDAGALENAVVILLADHGEAFNEHAMVHHGFGLFEELVHVPLVVRTYPPPETPGGPRRVAEPVELVDLLPTVLELVGSPVPGHVQGRSLARYVEGRAGTSLVRPDGGVFTEGAPTFYAHAAGRMKYIYTDLSSVTPEQAIGLKEMLQSQVTLTSLYGEQLFDLERDPGELTNLAPTRPGKLRRAREGMLAAYLRDTPGLRVLARGGASQATLRLRIRGAPGDALPSTLFAEPADVKAPGRLHLEPGDVDVVSWDALPEASIPGVSVELALEDASSPLEVYTGPGCTSRLQGGVVKVRELLPGAGAPLGLPPELSAPVACVFFTPRRTASPGDWQPSAEALERLRSLGYVR
jgi:arylsulfatase A-like enzyme